MYFLRSWKYNTNCCIDFLLIFFSPSLNRCFKFPHASDVSVDSSEARELTAFSQSLFMYHTDNSRENYYVRTCLGGICKYSLVTLFPACYIKIKDFFPSQLICIYVSKKQKQFFFWIYIISTLYCEIHCSMCMMKNLRFICQVKLPLNWNCSRCPDRVCWIRAGKYMFSHKKSCSYRALFSKKGPKMTRFCLNNWKVDNSIREILLVTWGMLLNLPGFCIRFAFSHIS